MRQIHANGLEISHNENQSGAGTVIINTCGFINDAKAESIDTILQYIHAKERGEVDQVYVMGCLSERYRKELEQEIREVDRYFGVKDIRKIIRTLGADYKNELIGDRMLLTPSHYAYMKISEGCDRTCSFCSIPFIRGNHVSRPLEDILREAELLVQKGVKELILIAQDLSYYGFDLYRKQKLTELVRSLTLISGIEWIRLHYTYPTNFPKDILPLMASNDKICNYIDIPLQHINDKVLQKMRRASGKKSIYKLLDSFRIEVPDAAIRTTLLVGHPGEGEKEFEELKEFVRNFRFDRLGVFPYSHEEGTYGYENFQDELTEETKQLRSDEIMLIQQDISRELNGNRVGNTYKVIIDRVEGEYYIGRTEFDSPEVDNEVLINKHSLSLVTGEFYQVKIISATEYDLLGEVL